MRAPAPAWFTVTVLVFGGLAAIGFGLAVLAVFS